MASWNTYLSSSSMRWITIKDGLRTCWWDAYGSVTDVTNEDRSTTIGYRQACFHHHGKCEMEQKDTTRMRDNAQRDGRPAEYTWRPLFNAAKFGWRPLLECRAVTLPKRETRWNLQGCPKLANRSQPLVCRSSPYYEDVWRRYRCLTSFFSDCRYMT